jgi:hypothetical protein
VNPLISFSDALDWSLHRKGSIDQARHNTKIREAIRNNLTEIVSQENIITQQGQKTVKIPIRTLELYRFRYNPYKQRHFGQGSGATRKGTVVGRTMRGRDQASRAGQKDADNEPQAGDEPGVDYYEAEVEIDELANILFEELQLPNLKPKKRASLHSQSLEFRSVRKRGPMANLDKRRTLLENLRRNALNGHPGYGELNESDLRFRSWNQQQKLESNAVIVAMRDVSASMGEFEKFVSRSFFFWTLKFLRTRYESVEITFVTHHTEAQEVEEEAFFQLGQSGGTKISAAYKLALEIIENRYPPRNWNSYVFHFSDGENYGSGDNAYCVELARQLLELCNLVGYGEIRPNIHIRSPLMTALAAIEDHRLATHTIRQRADVYEAMRVFFAAEEGS